MHEHFCETRSNEYVSVENILFTPITSAWIAFKSIELKWQFFNFTLCYLKETFLRIYGIYEAQF